MPKPSYTIDTLVRLNEKYPDDTFSLIMGADNIKDFHKWKNSEIIVNNYHRYIYPRPSYNISNIKIENSTIVDAPLMDISSTLIRTSIADGKEMPFFVHQKVYNYIVEMNLYKS
jgi:nicotinate-nucleotide adenylyltransferase